MKSLLTLLVGLALTPSAFAEQLLECTTQTPGIDYISVTRDGGEESLNIHLPSEAVTRLTVTQRSPGALMALPESQIGARDASGVVALFYSTQTGAGKIILKGTGYAVNCK